MDSIVEVRVPLLDYKQVTCSRKHTDRDGYWKVDPPIIHPNVFPSGNYLICDKNETPQMLLEQTHSFSNPCNIDAAINYTIKRRTNGLHLVIQLTK